MLLQKRGVNLPRKIIQDTLLFHILRKQSYEFLWDKATCRKLFWNTLVVVRRSWNVVLFLHSARKCGTCVLACVAQSCKLSDALLQDTLQDHSRRRSCGTPLCDTPVQLILDRLLWNTHSNSNDSGVGFLQAARHSTWTRWENTLVRHFCGASLWGNV